MRQPVRLGTVSLLACAVLAVTSAPAYALQALQQPSRATALLPGPALPLPEVSVTARPAPTLPVPTLPVPTLPVPTSPVPVPTVSVTAPQVPDKPRVSLPAPPGAPKILSSKRPAPRSAGPGSGSSGVSFPAPQAAAIPAATKQAANQPTSAAAAAVSVAGAQMQVEGAQRALDRVDDYLLSLAHDELCRALSGILDPLPERVSGLSPEVIQQLPPEIVNVVPERVLAGASVRCEASGAGSGNSGLTRVLGTLAQAGLVAVAALPIGLGLLAFGIALRRRGSRA